MTFALIEPHLGRTSGGLRYNAELVAASGGCLERHTVAGSWPEPSPEHVRNLYQLIAEIRSLDPSKPVLLDGLFASCLPKPVAPPVVILAHSLAQTEPGQSRESAAFRSASAVVVPSSFAADEVARRYDIEAVVAQPGVTEPGWVQVADREADHGAEGAPRVPHLMCLGAQEPNKNQLFLSAVLRELVRRGRQDWACTIAGPITDVAYVQELRTEVEDLEQVHWFGELEHKDVVELYRDADLLLLPSQAEAYGMVVREAAVAGIPAIVTAGTGAEEALVSGRALELDVQEWADALEQWIGTPSLRQRMAAEAHDARGSAAHPWTETARTIVGVLESV